jgi:dTDP-4-dehydrorhamnose reductase
MLINILVTGSDGQLGSELKHLVGLNDKNTELNSFISNFEFFFTNKQSLDIANEALVEAFCIKNDINAIINCAAYTAVDLAEQEHEKEKTFQINHLAVENLARISKKLSTSLVHISTDYVFDGEKNEPYIESDLTTPENVYGKSKLAGEKAMQAINPTNSIIIRTSWLYSPFGNNFVKTMLKLAATKDTLSVVSDQIGTPTSARDLARVILETIPKLMNENKNNRVKIYHVGNKGFCSWYEFAGEIFSLTNIKCQLNPIPTSDYPTDAIRPLYSVLNKKAFHKEFEIEIPTWQASLALVINEFEF